jgi:membrane protease YdiL (CAAX protease family)
LAAIIALLIYPVAFFVIKDPAALRWARVHGFSQMPHSLQLPLERRGRLLYFVKFLAVAILLYAWCRLFGVPLIPLLPHFAGWQHNVYIALTSTGILAIGRVWFLLRFKRVSGHLLNHGFARGALLTWLAIILIGAIVEETWRAVTLRASSETGFNSSVALIATSVVFLFCQLLGIPSRNQGLGEETLWGLAVSIALGCLFLFTGSLLVPLTVNILYNVLNLLLIRRRALNPLNQEGVPHSF